MPRSKKASNPLLAMTGQYSLFGDQGFEVGPKGRKMVLGQREKKKQGSLFGKKGLEGQKNLFPDTGVPDELVGNKPTVKKQGLLSLPKKAAKIATTNPAMLVQKAPLKAMAKKRAPATQPAGPEVPTQTKQALPAIAAVAGRLAPAIASGAAGGLMQQKKGMAEEGERLGSAAGGKLGGMAGGAAAPFFRVPPKVGAATGTALGTAAGGYLGRKAGQALQGRVKGAGKRTPRPQGGAAGKAAFKGRVPGPGPAKPLRGSAKKAKFRGKVPKPAAARAKHACKGYSLAESEAIRVAFANNWDEHKQNLAVALAGVQLTGP